VANREDGLEVNAEKTKYMVMSRHQNAGRIHYLLIGNIYFEKVAKFKCFGKKSIKRDLYSRRN
jgi:hypothetical protein